LKKIFVGVIDYKIGNHASVVHCLRELGFRVSVSNDPAKLNQTDLLFLPGVGAFSPAMQALHQQGLVEYLQEEVKKHKPIIGICLGMQLLTDASFENGYTKGLGLIPGEIVPLDNPKWHIGWNTAKCIQENSMLKASNDKDFYFNHSHIYKGDITYQVSVSQHKKEFATVIQNSNVVGIQFHPEKSQQPGRELLKNLIVGMCDA